MDEMIEILKKRRNELMKLKKEKEKALIGAPEGHLRVCKSRGTVQYYQRTAAKDTIGTYIPRKDIELARKLAQKDYEKKVLSSIEQEVKAIDRYIKALPSNRAEEVYEAMHVNRQSLILPIRETDEQFAHNWERFSFVGKEIDDTTPYLLTEKGERVRSKSELIIADILHREGIPYRYECPLILSSYGKVYPDFTVLNVRERKEIYWEHLGMMSDVEYVERAFQKISSYEESGIFPGDGLILTWENHRKPLNPRIVRQLINKYLL